MNELLVWAMNIYLSDYVNLSWPMCMQARAVAITFEVVRFVVRVLVLCSQAPGESLATRDYACVRLGLVGRGSGWSVGMVPQKILEFKGYKVASESIFGQI